MKTEFEGDEAEKFKAWNEQHLKEYHDGVEPYAGAIGGRITFLVTETGIGQVVKVRCGLCPYAKEGDLSDYENW